ncbi:SPOR domain-containing protein [Parasedimentitalea psychrophila]|uniref:SPOR domain-containing protein n=2 Tax=Parasedimentitalea psychrophila TaxID=2997337 RepID=A0A9Y2KXG0_9RHOB|nr:SPOR domain-containing protein [Parasedimentitalea psychrophila]WIY24100.1 SPOR domain-containing protein [Parasedimentitalea psychrophila]
MAFNAQAGESQAYSLQGASSSRGAPDDGRYQTQYQQHEPQAYGQADPLATNEDAPIAFSGDVTRTLGFLGAVASLALIVGVGVWGYKLVARDVSGVPVVRSLEGPMRVQPENPGGQAAVNQGLAVNAVAANGIASDPADRLILAPSSLRLTEDDVPVAEVVISGSAAPVQALNDAGQAAESAATQPTEIDVLVAALTAGVTPLSTTTNRVGATLASASAASIVQPAPLLPVRSETAVTAPAVLNAPGVKVSLRPLVRPARFSPSLYSASASQGRSTLEVDAASLPAGTRLAQLGAYESADVARAEWDRIYGRFEDYLEGKKRVIQKAQSGGRTFYRLRAMGFADLSGARRFCATLVAGKADCIPVTTR